MNTSWAYSYVLAECEFSHRSTTGKKGRRTLWRSSYSDLTLTLYDLDGAEETSILLSFIFLRLAQRTRKKGDIHSLPNTPLKFDLEGNCENVLSTSRVKVNLSKLDGKCSVATKSRCRNTPTTQRTQAL